MWFDGSNLLLNVLQAVCVGLPAAGLPLWLDRTRKGAWTLVLPVSIVASVVVIGSIPDSAGVYTWAALVGVPLGCALALGWAAHGARWPLALLVAPLLTLAWAAQDSVAGELATDALIVGAAVTLGRLLAGAAPLTVVKVALIAMAVSDAVLVFTGELAQPAAVLNAAEPAPGLPQLQAGILEGSSLGFGDFLAAAVLGGILACENVPQWPYAVALLVVSFAWDQLFLVVDLLPATVPPAIVLLLHEARRWRVRSPRAA